MFAGTGTTWRNRTEPRAGAGRGLLNSPPSPRWLPRRLQANPRHLFFCWRKEPSLSWLSLRFWELPHSSLPNLTMILQGGHSPAFFFFLLLAKAETIMRTAVTVWGKLLPPFCGAEGQGASQLAFALAGAPGMALVASPK